MSNLSKLNNKNLQDIKNFDTSGPAETIKEYKQLQGVTVGDVLLRYPKKLGVISKIAEIVTKACPVPVKYQVVYIDDNGIAWLKQISVRGGLTNALVNPLNHAESWHYEIDPRQLEAIILGATYDSRAEYKDFRQQHPGYGSKK